MTIQNIEIRQAQKLYQEMCDLKKEDLYRDPYLHRLAVILTNSKYATVDNDILMATFLLVDSQLLVMFATKYRERIISTHRSCFQSGGRIGYIEEMAIALEFIFHPKGSWKIRDWAEMIIRKTEMELIHIMKKQLAGEYDYS